MSLDIDNSLFFGIVLDVLVLKSELSFTSVLDFLLILNPDLDLFILDSDISLSLAIESDPHLELLSDLVLLHLVLEMDLFLKHNLDFPQFLNTDLDTDLSLYLDLNSPLLLDGGRHPGYDDLSCKLGLYLHFWIHILN